MPRFAPLLLASLVPLAAALAACSSKDPGGTLSCQAYSPPSGTDLQHPTVSFKSDVLPIFQASCTFSDCHALRNDPQRVYLGPPKAAGLPTDPNEVYGLIVNKPAAELSAMSYVTPSDPANSFLMRKMDGDQCALSAKCTNGDCGALMPLDSDKLVESTRLVVYRWIAQGAPNN